MTTLKHDEAERIARVTHEVNRVWCRFHGDFSQPPWEQAPEWQRQSALNGVRFHAENPGMSPEQSHENWMREKQEQGWTYGARKDSAKKTHPCMRPYAELPREQQYKDRLFYCVVTTMLGREL